mmetsp:Transcript_27226/g.59575  ORF Transcript_27226/g.59575 Transcript_27226/m.59575 type:complete len:93 (+) Transcript_27226:84-362(+)
MCRVPTGWVHRMQSKKINIWDVRKMRPDRYLCKQPFFETKFNRPYWLNKLGMPMFSRTPALEIGRPGEKKYCDMSALHRQDAKKKTVSRAKS